MHKGLLAWNIILTILLIAIAVAGYFQMDKIVVPDEELDTLQEEIDQNREAIREVEASVEDNRDSIIEQDEHMVKLIDGLQKEIAEVEMVAESNRDNIFALSVSLREVIEDVERLKK